MVCPNPLKQLPNVLPNGHPPRPIFWYAVTMIHVHAPITKVLLVIGNWYLVTLFTANIAAAHPRSAAAKTDWKPVAVANAQRSDPFRDANRTSRTPFLVTGMCEASRGTGNW